MKPNRNDTKSRQTRAENELFAAIVSMRSIAECRNLFRDLCTPAELQALVDRWQAVELLAQGLPYRRIHELTGVSVTTVGRVARFLTNGFGGYATAIERTQPKSRKDQPSRSHSH